jgi:hypothetical protein
MICHSRQRDHSAHAMALRWTTDERETVLAKSCLSLFFRATAAHWRVMILF